MSIDDIGDDAHALRAERAACALRASPAVPLALAKGTSNLFRDRAPAARLRLDLREFDHVLEASGEGDCIDVEGLVTYEALADWSLARGCMPAVVPQLKTITVGGAIAGVAIEATSFRHGLVHHTMRELEVLTPAGEIVVCTPHNEHRELFFGFPNSYGCLGYALRVRLAATPVLPFVHVRHRRFADAGAFFGAVDEACRSDADFVDGVVFGLREHVLSTARFAPQAPWTSDYTCEAIYWQSLRQKDEDYLSTADYLWRWDTDWFWCSRQFGAQHPIVRRLLGRERLNSRTWQRWMRRNARWGFTQRLARWRGLYRESVIQDVDIPFARAGEFLDFLRREIAIVPVWVCPVRGDLPGERFPLYPLGAAPMYVNFGFWDVLQTREPHEAGYFNRRVEAEVMRLGGIKSLYSDSYFSPQEFGTCYGLDAYEALKERYDPHGRAPQLYDKCVLRV
jgi:FAD/FMN-containing dehydrogenase